MFCICSCALTKCKPDRAGLEWIDGGHRPCPDSGNRYLTELLLKSLKAGKPKVRLRPMSNLAAAEALRKGQVDGIDFFGGVPIPLVASLFHEGKPQLVFLEVSESQIEAIREEG